MSLRIYNSLTKTKEEFIPLNKNAVKIYVCGITPYDTTHLGHAFTYIFFDTLIRYFRYKKYDVLYTQNVTDINDRDNDLLKRAEENGLPWQNLSNFWTDKFLEDMHALNWVMPDHFLFASAHIPTMVKITEDLLKNGFAYRVNGGVYFDISKKKDFGKLSGFSKEKMLETAREFEEDLDNPDKKNKLDITLWRPTVLNQPMHIPSFKSPFGSGRPGWHLECSAMSLCSLGQQIDIHGGGIDLIYPHHESEIAQSEGATGKIPFVKYWIHTQLVSYKGAKISKSEGNLLMISDLRHKYSANAIRYILLAHHYRTEWAFREKELIEAEEKLNKIRNLLKPNLDSYSSSEHGESRSIKQFEQAMDDDLNTPKGLEIMLNAENIEELRIMSEIFGFKF